MSTKEKLLRLLDEHAGEYISGEQAAEMLNVSRTAIWKAANSLRTAGFPIDAVQNKGYCMNPQMDYVSDSGVRSFLNKNYQNLQLEIMPVASSTNLILREKADAGAPEGHVLIANEQTGGRGRRGKQFFSPADTGVYLSILLRPKNYTTEQAIHITTMAAASACMAIDDISLRQAQIKWVNDIYLDNRKVCGILTEAFYDIESSGLDYIILGLGFNVYQPETGFPNEISQIAGSILDHREQNKKNKLIAGFLNRFFDFYQKKDFSDYLDIYREKSMVIGKKIWIHAENSVTAAAVLELDKNCHLIVRYDDGSIGELRSGEISIRISQDAT